MIFRTRREQRRRKLIGLGLLPFEAKELSKVPLNVPYFRMLVGERRQEYKKFIKAERLTAWISYIKKLYDDNGWVTVIGSHRIYDPWKLLRDYEERYRHKMPMYESPWEGQRRMRLDFLGKMERTMAKQRGLAYG